MITPADSAPQAPGQQPQASSPGPAPAPYAGPSQRPEPPRYDVGDGAARDPGMDVMGGVTGNAVQESAYAHDMGAGLVAPYYGGQISPVRAHGDADPGGRDDVADSVAGAVANAGARWHEHQGDTYGQGSQIGDLMTFPASPLDPGTVGGLTAPSGAFYDPPRGGSPETYVNTGNQPPG